MRRTVITVVLCVLAPMLAAVPAVAAMPSVPAAPAAPAVKHVVRDYGAGPVRLAASQGADITFHARRGDHVTVKVRGVGARAVACQGRTTVVDGRGPLRGGSDRVVRIRTSGNATIRFRERCRASAPEPLPVRVQLVKLRMHRVSVGQPATRVRAARRGFLDVAWTRVPRTGRVKLTARNQGGLATPAPLLLLDSRLRRGMTPTASIEDGRRLVIKHPTGDIGPERAMVRRGMRIGLVVSRAGTVDVRRSLTREIELDGPAVSLPSKRGREYILTVQVPLGIRTYLDGAGQDSWTIFDLDGEREVPTSGHILRVVVSSDEDAPSSEEVAFRIRTILAAPDLLVGGAPVRFESSDPGQWFFARVPRTVPGPVRLSADDVTVSGGAWFAEIPGPCHRECFSTGLRVSDVLLVADGELPTRDPYEVMVRFERAASGGVTLTLAR